MLVPLLTASIVSTHGAASPGSSTGTSADGGTLDPPGFLPGLWPGLLEMVGLVLQDLDLLAQESLDANQITRFRFVAKRIRQTVSTGACGSTDAVDVDFGFVGQVKVEHVRDVLDVDASAGDVRGHEDEHVAVSEGIEGPCPRCLTLVAVNRIRRDANLAELLCQPVRTVLGTREHDAARHHLAFDEVDEQLALVGFLYEGNVLFNAVRGGRLWTDVNLHGTMEHLIGEFADGLGHCSAEHQVLPFSGHQGKNPVNVLAEPHVEHAVGFVKDKMFHLTQVEMPLLVQVKQPSGCCDQNVHPASEGFDLRRLPHTAEDHGGMEGELTSVHAETVANLGSEFSGGRENQRSNRSSGGGFSSCEMMKNGEGKGSRFPRPGLGDAEDVPDHP